MRNLRKFVTLAIGAFFAVAIFTACGGGGNTDNPTEAADIAAAETPPTDTAADNTPTFITIQGQDFGTGLEVLRLRGENLSNEDILPLQYMRNLSELDLGGNDIGDIAPLAELENLVWLELDGNRISDVSALSALESLSFLFINDNEIFDISPLAGLDLMHLSVHNNQISDLTPLVGFSPASYVVLLGNPITDWSPVEHIEDVLGRPDELTEQAARRAEFTLFARAIREFNVGSADDSELAPIGWATNLAHIVELDEDGTLGVLAFRQEDNGHGGSLTVGRIFFIAVREIFYKDLGILEGFPFVAAVTQPQDGGFGRPVLVGGDGGMAYYTTFELRFSPQHGLQVVENFTVAHEMWDEGKIRLFEDGLEAVLLTEEELSEILGDYGLDDVILQFAMADHTEFIFSQSFE